MSKLNKHPQSSVFYRRMLHTHPLIVRGEGVYLFDAEGNRYLDGSGGALVVNIGHGVQAVAQAMAEQAAKAAYIHGSMFTSESNERYAQELAQICPMPEAKFYFLTSGSEAIEAAIKFARQVHVDGGDPDRYLTISRWGSYHGATLGALGVTGKPKMRKKFAPMLVDMPHIPPPYCYRCPFGLATPQCDIRCATALEEEILRRGSDKVSAFIAEPISGATLGAVVPPKEYWPLIRKICDKYGVLLIADEVMTGLGRTGKWFAVDHWGIEPDVLAIGKGAAGGYFPLSVLAVKAEHADLMAAESGDFIHGGTFSHHAVGTATGIATLNYMKQNDLVSEVNRKGQILQVLLKDKLAPLKWIGDIRGMGLMWGVELVQDKQSKTPFDPQLHISQKVADAAFQRGLIIYPGSGCVDGINGDHFMIGPPFTITEQQIESLVEILCQTLVAVLD